MLCEQWAKDNGLLLEAYSPLGSNNQVKESLAVPEVQAISKELGITPAQVLISWQVQRGVSRVADSDICLDLTTESSIQVVVLPKSVTPSRIVENLKSEPKVSLCLWRV